MDQPLEGEEVSSLHDKRLPPRQQLRLFTSRLPMTLQSAHWLWHHMNPLQAIQHGGVHLERVRDPAAGHAQ